MNQKQFTVQGVLGYKFVALPLCILFDKELTANEIKLISIIVSLNNGFFDMLFEPITQTSIGELMNLNRYNTNRLISGLIKKHLLKTEGTSKDGGPLKYVLSLESRYTKEQINCSIPNTLKSVLTPKNRGEDKQNNNNTQKKNQSELKPEKPSNSKSNNKPENRPNMEQENLPQLETLNNCEGVLSTAHPPVLSTAHPPSPPYSSIDLPYDRSLDVNTICQSVTGTNQGKKADEKRLTDPLNIKEEKTANPPLENITDIQTTETSNTYIKGKIQPIHQPTNQTKIPQPNSQGKTNQTKQTSKTVTTTSQKPDISGKPVGWQNTKTLNTETEIQLDEATKTIIKQLQSIKTNKNGGSFSISRKDAIAHIQNLGIKEIQLRIEKFYYEVEVNKRQIKNPVSYLNTILKDESCIPPDTTRAQRQKKAQKKAKEKAQAVKEEALKKETLRKSKEDFVKLGQLFNSLPEEQKKQIEAQAMETIASRPGDFGKEYVTKNGAKGYFCIIERNNILKTIFPQYQEIKIAQRTDNTKDTQDTPKTREQIRQQIKESLKIS